MSGKRLITVLFFAALVCISLTARIYYFDTGIDMDELSLGRVFVGENGIDVSAVFSGGININSVYMLMVSVSCLFFGNNAVAGLYLNVLLQMATVMMIFFAINIVANRYVAFAAGIVAAAAPVYIAFMDDFSGINLTVAAGGAAILLIMLIIKALLLLKKPKVKNKYEGDADMKEIVSPETEEVKTNYIENPLPVPKRKPHKQMDYAVNVKDDDDYDIKDMTGKDFFDIE